MPMKFNKDAIPTTREIVPNPKQIPEFKKLFGIQTAEAIKEHIKRDIIPSLGIKNFEDSAIAELKKNLIPITQQSVSQQATTFLNDFVKNLDTLARYNEDTGEIEMHELVWRCEYGDSICPVLKTVTRSLEDVTENRG